MHPEKFLLLASLGFALAACETTTSSTEQTMAAEQPVESELAPMPNPGMPPVGLTVYGKRNGEDRRSQVISLEGNIATSEDNTGCTWTQDLSYGRFFSPTKSWENCSGNAGYREFSGMSGDDIWPLEVGKAWSYDATGYSNDNGWASATGCEVTGTARVTVPAGSYDTYRVLCTSKWTKKVYYVSPEEGRPVKISQERNDRRSRSSEYTWEYVRSEAAPTS